MELLIEMILELVLEGSLEVAKNRKINKWIRYPVTVLLILFIVFVLGIIGFVGISMILSDMKYAIYGGIFFIFVDVILIISGIKKFKKEIKLRKSNK